MVTINDLGIAATSRPDYIAVLNSRFRAALGNDLDISTPTPQGQLIGILADTLFEVDQGIVAAANGLSLSAATGRQLDDICSLFGMERGASSRSTVTATLSGAEGTVIPAGSLAATTGGDVFETINSATIGAGGTVDTEMRATRTGAIVVAANTLTRVVTRVSGWDAITNAAAAVTGLNAETDAALRARYRAVLGRSGRTSLAAIRGNLANLEGVTAHRVVENTTNASVTVRGIAIDANSILAIVEGGSDSDIANILLGAKALGVGTSGDESATVTSPWGQAYTARFRRPDNIAIAVTLQTGVQLGFAADGVSQLTTRLVNYVAALDIGEGIGANDLYAPAYQIPNHTVSDITVTRKVASIAGLVSGDTPGTTTTLDIPATATLTGIGGDTESVSIATATGVAVATIAEQLQAALRAKSFAGAGSIAVTLEGTGANRRFVITVPDGVSIRSGGLTGNLSTLLGFDAASNPEYRSRGVTSNDINLDQRLTLTAADIAITVAT